MARREYRTKTGKLTGYSQTETDRFGGKTTAKIMSVVLLVSMGYSLVKDRLFPEKPAATQNSQQSPVKRVPADQTPALSEAPSVSSPPDNRNAESDDQSSEVKSVAKNSPTEATRTARTTIKPTSLYEYKDRTFNPLFDLPEGSEVRLLGKFGDGWVHVEVAPASREMGEGYVPAWALPIEQ